MMQNSLQSRDCVCSVQLCYFSLSTEPSYIVLAVCYGTFSLCLLFDILILMVGDDHEPLSTGFTFISQWGNDAGEGSLLACTNYTHTQCHVHNVPFGLPVQGIAFFLRTCIGVFLNYADCLGSLFVEIFLISYG